MSVFKESPRTHLHVRTSIMIGVVLMLVIVLSMLFYYTRAPTGVSPEGSLHPPSTVLTQGSTAAPMPAGLASHPPTEQ